MNVGASNLVASAGALYSPALETAVPTLLVSFFRLGEKCV